MDPPAFLPAAVGLATAPAAISASDVAQYLIEDHDRIAQRLNDVVIHRIFSAGLNLQVALGLMDDPRGAREICQAVDELDRAIRDIRECVFDPGPPMA
jgi:two-component system, NarL family, sensor histidine kinase DevS